jgi:hypothetical protein
VADRFCWPLSRASLTPHKLWLLWRLHFPWYLEKKMDMIYDDDNDDSIVVKFELLGIPHLLAIFVGFCLGEL